MKRRQRRLLVNLFSLALLAFALYLNFLKPNTPEPALEQLSGKSMDMAATGKKPVQTAAASMPSASSK